jgi:thiosulfate/3-mercaptopyruvate sulfurtransferase
MNRTSLRFLVSIFALALLSFATGAAQNPSSLNDKDLQSGSPVLMQADELAKLLKLGKIRPLVFFVGPRAFYVQSHVPGAEFLGPTGRPEGLNKLRTRANSLPRETPIVIYCGCCPWVHCPNIHPAYSELKKMGFTKLRVLHLETSFGTDWAEKGYPVEKGS